MSRVQKLRVFVGQRLDAALEDILGMFEKTVAKYEEEAALCREVISRQHALLCALHKPLMELPSADAFTQQLLLRTEEVPSEHQDQVQEGQPIQDLNEADIIQFTYNPRIASRPDEDLDLLSARTAWVKSGGCPDQEVHMVSSETEDSEDYSKDSTDTRFASNQQKPKRPGGPISCRVCSRTFKAHRFLVRHVKAHLQEVQPVCGLCGERFDAADGLKLHIQTHQTNQMRKSELENQTRTMTRTRARRSQQPECSERGPSCEDCGKNFIQLWKKRRHRCQPCVDGEEEPKKKSRRRRVEEEELRKKSRRRRVEEEELRKKSRRRRAEEEELKKKS